MFISFLACFLIWIFSISAEFPNHGLNESSKVNWAFKKFALVDQPPLYFGKENYFRLKNYDFGSFGASKVSLEINSAAALNNIKEKVSIHFDNANNIPAELYFNASSSSIKNKTLTFDITAPEGVHDVYIYIPSDAKFNYFKSVEFYPADPPPHQWYYIISKHSGRALDFRDGFSARTYSLRPYSSQMFRFEKVENGIYKIAAINGNILSVANFDTGIVRLKPFSNLPYEVWWIDDAADNDGYHLAIVRDFTKCLSLNHGKDSDGAAVEAVKCDINFLYYQTWYIIKAC